MGLDISYTDKLIRVPKEDIPEGAHGYNEVYDDWQEASPHSLIWIPTPQKWWPNHTVGLEDNTWYYNTGENKGSFRAGSYGGYNEWRDDLAQAIGWLSGARGAWESGEEYGPPFMELINFSDSQGYIGPEISEKLYQDFVNYEDQIMDKVDQWFLKMELGKEYNTSDMKWFEQKYNDWKEAFNQARNGGMVMFH